MTYSESILAATGLAVAASIDEQVEAIIAENVGPVQSELTAEREVTAGLRGELADAQRAAEDATAARDSIAAELDAERLSHTADVAARDEVIRARDLTIAEQDALIRDLNARIAELEAGGGEPPTLVPTLLGGTPWSGYATVASRDATLARWGDGVAVRLFNKEADTLIPAPPRGNAGALIVSWKPTSLAVITEDAVRAALANLQPGDMHGIWHEPDVKVRNVADDAEAARLAAFYKELAWAYYQTAKRVRPDLLVFACGSAWTWDPSTAFDPADYWERRAFDIFLADYDGLAGPKDYRPVTVKFQAWLESVDCPLWGIAEYGVKTRAASGNTPAFTNAQRPAWLEEQTEALLADDWPPVVICLYENDTSAEGRKYNLTTAPEKGEWDRLIVVARD